MMNNKLILNSRQEKSILDSARLLLPWWFYSNDKDILDNQTIDSPESYLNSFYLFPLEEITIESGCNDTANYVNDRFQVLLSAACTSSVSVVLLISSRNGKTNVHIGFRKDGEKKGDLPNIFESLINGIMPGKKISYDDRASVTSLINNCNHGGMITGMPTISEREGSNRFNIASVIRSLYGRNFTLAIVSRPISKEEIQRSFAELIEIRDSLHLISKQDVSESKSKGRADSQSHQKSIGISDTKGSSAGGSIGFGILTPFGFIGGGGTYSQNSSKTNTESNATGKSNTITEEHAYSLSLEKQNGYALELEKIAGQYIERIIGGFNSGLWESSITFAAEDRMTCEILGGSFVGELSEPNERLLPPPRLYIGSLKPSKILFLPKTSSINTIFPKDLASYITSEELALISSPPYEQVSGYQIKSMPSLALSDTNDAKFKLGNITDRGNPIENSFITLSEEDLNKHLFVCGLTGSGKSTTVKNILKNLQCSKIPFLVLESAKRDYRQLLADDSFKNELDVFTIGDSLVSPISFNPFYVQKEVHPLIHIDYLKAIFNASFSLYGPMPHIVEKCLYNVYQKRGWDLTKGTHPFFKNGKGEIDESRYSLAEHYYCFPTLSDLKDEVNDYVKNEMEYKGDLRDNIRTAIVARLESLCIGAKGLLFNTYDFYPIEKLLSRSTIFEMENLVDDDDKAFFVGLTLVLISEYRQRYNPAINPGSSRNRGLKHFLVIEEAHRLLKNVSIERTSEMMGNPKGKAVEVFCNVISEMRSLGQGVGVVEQIPSKISPDVIKNSNTKIVHRLVSKDDQSLLAGSLSISDDDALYLNRLITGHALCHKEGMERPVECQVIDNVESHAIDNETLEKLMKNKSSSLLHIYDTYELSNFIANDGKVVTIKLLNSILTESISKVPEILECAKNELRQKLVQKRIRIKYDDKVINDYFVKLILELLCSGIYSAKSKISKDLKVNLERFFTDSKSELFHKKILESFKEMWEIESIREFIINVVTLLSTKYLLDRKMNKLVNCQSIIATFFIDSNSEVIEEVQQKILTLKERSL
jgi:hypothetical protein